MLTEISYASCVFYLFYLRSNSTIILLVSRGKAFFSPFRFFCLRMLTCNFSQPGEEEAVLAPRAVADPTPPGPHLTASHEQTSRWRALSILLGSCCRSHVSQATGCFLKTKFFFFFFYSPLFETRITKQVWKIILHGGVVGGVPN